MDTLFSISRKRFFVRAGILIIVLAASSGAVLAYLGSDANIVATRIEYPAEIYTGQPFDLYLEAHNISDAEQQLVSLGLEAAGVKILKTVPNFRTVKDDERWTEYVFPRQQRPDLLPDDRVRLRVRMVVTQPGDYAGEFVLWFNNHVRGDMLSLQFTALAHPAPWLGH